MYQQRLSDVKYYLPAMGWAVVILVLSAMPSQQLPQIDIISIDKIGHLGVYWILTMLILWGASKQPDANLKIWSQSLSIILAIGTIYGILIELMQYLFFPGRYFEILDALANFVGCILGIISFKLLFKL